MKSSKSQFLRTVTPSTGVLRKITLQNFNLQGRKGLCKRAEFQLPAKGMNRARRRQQDNFNFKCTRLRVLAFLSAVDRGSPSLQWAEAAFAWRSWATILTKETETLMQGVVLGSHISSPSPQRYTGENKLLECTSEPKAHKMGQFSRECLCWWMLNP